MVRRKKGVVATPPPRTVLTRKEATVLGELTLNPPAPTQAAIESLRKARRYPTKDPDAPRGDDPLILCRKCKVWSARKGYCSNCKEERK
jgi:hypothetical protein